MIVSRRTLLLGLFLFSVVAIVSTWVICPENNNNNNNNNPLHQHHWYLRYPQSKTMMASSTQHDTENRSKDSTTITNFRVAHLGNSIQYYNDMPRLLQHMLQQQHFASEATQDSCLRGGATLPSLWEKGNGMAKKFATDAAKREDGTFDIGAPTVPALLQQHHGNNNHHNKHYWDVVIINDHTQSPARRETKQASEQALKQHYIPLLLQCQIPQVIFLQTAAYKTHGIKDSADLGSFDEFTETIWHGYHEYAKLVRQESNHQIDAKVAPVGLAYQAVKRMEDSSLWKTLYARDDFHPSPHGTLLEASVLYCTIVGGGREKPPVYNTQWWKTARYMQPPDTEPLPLPTDAEAAILQDVAWKVCHEWARQR